jgi:hypothetical protein
VIPVTRNGSGSPLIAHLFRAYHEIPALGSAPFTHAQLERIRAGAVPDGEL